MDGYGIWNYFWISVSALIILATLIVCVVVPELKHLYGSLVRRCLASYFCHHVVGLLVSIDWDVDSLFGQCLIVAARTCFGMASTLWLNVMSIEMWRRFRTSFVEDFTSEAREKTSLFTYSIYVWGITSVYFVLAVMALYYFYGTTTPWSSLRYQLFKVTSVYVWLVIDKGFLLCNAYLYFSTAFTIERLKKESRGPMVDGVNNRHIFAEKWLNLYVQLYCLMGIGTIITLYAIAVPFSMFTMYSACVAAVKALCCGLIFKIFVLKDDIRRSFTEQFTKGMRKLGLIRPRHSTTSTENISTRL